MRPISNQPARFFATAKINNLIRLKILIVKNSNLDQ